MSSKNSKKKTPEQKREEFELWMQSNEYQHLLLLKKLKSELPILLETNEDFIAKYQNLLDEVQNVGKIFQIKKTQVKRIKQEQIRSAFFGGVNKRDEPFEIDFQELDFENKEYQKTCRHVKLTLIDFLKITDNLDILDENRYQDFRKNKIIYKYKEFINFFKQHIKKNGGHDETEQLLKITIKPFQELMEINFRLSIFEQTYPTQQLIEENYFQYKAIIDKFALKYQPCQNILFRTSEKITSDPDFYSLFKKLNYNQWRENLIEKYYIEPLEKQYNLMRANLLKTFSQGMGFWYQPLKLNQVFLNDVEKLIKIDQRAEFLFGNCLTRQQTNFIFKIFQELYNSQAKNIFFPKQIHKIKEIIPYLTVLKAMRKITDIYQQKTKISKNFIHINLLHKKYQKVNYELKTVKNPQQEKRIEEVIPIGYQSKKMERSINGEIKEILINDNDQEELEKYGYFFILNQLLPENQVEEFVNESLKLRYIDEIILQEIYSIFILKGMTSTGYDYVQDRQLAQQNMQKINKLIEQEKNQKKHKIRPPQIWNYKESNKENKIYFSQNQKNELQNKQIQQLISYIKDIGELLTSYQEKRWKKMIDLISQYYEELKEQLIQQ